jgi:pimeloyl-ACP methyl ester carboxylesterase
MQPRQLDLPVDGGKLRILLWGTGEHVAVAVHGITASAMCWPAVARQLPPTWTLAAPDLRGRGHSNELPGPYGLAQHTRDVAAVLRYFAVQSGEPPVLLGHSLGAYISLLTRDAYPDLSRKLILLDGGLPLPVPEDADLDAILDATLGPAIARLSQTFPDETAYLDFWRAHPALAAHWTKDVEAYVCYDLRPAAGAGLRSRAVEDAVRTDGRDLLAGTGIATALDRLKDPTPLLTAPMGMFGARPGLQPPELVEAWQRRAPNLRPRQIPDVNHYTLLFTPHATAAIAAAIAVPDPLATGAGSA